MISHIGKVSLECFKNVKATQKEEVDGKLQDKEIEVTLRFELNIPMGSPYELVHEVLGELSEEVNKMQELSKKQAEEREKQAKSKGNKIDDELDLEEIKESKTTKKGNKQVEEN